MTVYRTSKWSDEVTSEESNEFWWKRRTGARSWVVSRGLRKDQRDDMSTPNIKLNQRLYAGVVSSQLGMKVKNLLD
jgi:hypothetical protein